MIDPPNKYFRLSLGSMVRLRSAYIVNVQIIKQMRMVMLQIIC